MLLPVTLASRFLALAVFRIVLKTFLLFAPALLPVPCLIGAIEFSSTFFTLRFLFTVVAPGVSFHERMMMLDMNGVVLHPEALLNLIRAQTLRSERPNPLIEKVHFSLPYSAGSPGACPVLLA